MAENKAGGPVIGLSFDGTGLGTDGTVWGGEVLVADYRTFTRAAHLVPVPMPGSARHQGTLAHGTGPPAGRFR
jgi:hydrogenase maturation protein HypF